jgi:cysteine desulfurase
LTEDELYFDCNGSTPLHPLVADLFLQASTRDYGNSGAGHAAGLRARAAIAAARAEVAAALGAREDEVVFTSGGTEANNHALRGVMEAAGTGHLIVGRHEHGSVLRTVEWLERRGHPVTWLDPDANGRLRVDDVAAALRPDTKLVALMFANNETGVLQPVHEVGELLATHSAVYFVDAVCGVGKARVHFDGLRCDLLSFGGHKVHAPKGVGALLVRRGTRIAPFVLGCGQQSGRRSGTENTPGVVALGRTLALMASGALGSMDDVGEVTQHLAERLFARFPRAQRNGAGPFLPNTLNVWFPGVPALVLQAALAARGASVASAASSSGAPSHVLLSMGLGRERAAESIRISLGLGATRAAADRLVDLLAECLPPLQPNEPEARRPMEVQR